MAYQAIFERREIKYMIDARQKEELLQVMAPFMEPDPFARATVRNIYFDTDTYRLIRRSIEKPAYKEKLRLRSYSRAEADSPVFVELKKKYDEIVYKRRLAMPEAEAMDWLCGRRAGADSQIGREIDHLLSYYETIRPAVFLSYERDAYRSLSEDGFRVTFDQRVLARREELALDSDLWGTPLLPEGKVLMELKCSGGIPLWMSRALTERSIFKTSFSKYGTAYETLIYPTIRGGISDV